MVGDRNDYTRCPCQPRCPWKLRAVAAPPETLEAVVGLVRRGRCRRSATGARLRLVTAPVETLEDLVRAELRPVARVIVARILRDVLLDVAREEIGRLVGESPNGRPAPPTEIALGGHGSPQETAQALGEGSDPPPARRQTRRRCTSCGEEKALRGFERGRAQCRACRAEAARARYRERQARARAARSNGAEAEEPG
jgi:hypothetical protein